MNNENPASIIFDTNGNALGTVDNPLVFVPIQEQNVILNRSNGIIDAYIATASTAVVKVYALPYTEQTTNAQRSIVSTSAQDAAAGTGAKTVLITYYDQTCTGPFTETIALNGTTAVNTVNTNICFVEAITVLTVGSRGNVNVGQINLKSAIAGGGSTIISIVAGDGRDFMGHHYVSTNRTCYIRSISGGVAGPNGAVIWLSCFNPTVNTSPEIQCTGTKIKLGPSVNTAYVPFSVPLKIVGPAKITTFLRSDGTSGNTYTTSFDYTEI